MFDGDGFFTLIFSGESSDPKLLLSRLTDEIERVKAEGLDKSLYDSIKKSTYGGMIMESNNAEAVAWKSDICFYVRRRSRMILLKFFLK